MSIYYTVAKTLLYLCNNYVTLTETVILIKYPCTHQKKQKLLKLVTKDNNKLKILVFLMKILFTNKKRK